MFTSSVKELQSKTELGVQSLSHVQLFVTPSTAACQASLSFTISQSLLKLLSIVLMMSSNHVLLPPSRPALSLSQHQGLFQWVSSSHKVDKILQLQHQSFQWIFRADFLKDWLVWFPCSPREFQESPPALQFESINSSMLNLLYGPTLTSMHDYWKNHRFD